MTDDALKPRNKAEADLVARLERGRLPRDQILQTLEAYRYAAEEKAGALTVVSEPEPEQFGLPLSVMRALGVKPGAAVDWKVHTVRRGPNAGQSVLTITPTGSDA